MPTLANKPHYEGSEATETDNSHYDELAEHIKYKEGSPTIKYADSLVLKYIFLNHFISLYF